MPQGIIVGIILILLALGVATFLIIKKLSELQKPQDEGAQKLMLDLLDKMRAELGDKSDKSRKEVEEKLDKISQTFQKSLSASSFTLQKQFKDSADIIKDVTSKLTKLDETNTQVLSFSKQLQSLENVLKNPKQRGILGEYFLENLLGHVLTPAQYQMQYKFKNGEIVDAVIFFKDKVIPIDAKFSLEKYNKIVEEKDAIRRGEFEKEFKMDVKNRIDETSKYIRPSEDTTDFAFMFIPAEGIYYNLLIYKVGTVQVSTMDLIEYAFKKHVIIVSPTSFFAYLETVLHGLKALKMEESVKEIIKKVGELGKHLNQYDEYMKKMGNSLGTTVNMYNGAYREFKKVDKDIYRVTDKEIGGAIEPLLIDKPSEE
jgi:DNA recombination protein RmuC